MATDSNSQAADKTHINLPAANPASVSLLGAASGPSFEAPEKLMHRLFRLMAEKSASDVFISAGTTDRKSVV